MTTTPTCDVKKAEVNYHVPPTDLRPIAGHGDVHKLITQYRWLKISVLDPFIPHYKWLSPASYHATRCTPSLSLLECCCCATKRFDPELPNILALTFPLNLASLIINLRTACFSPWSLSPAGPLRLAARMTLKKKYRVTMALPTFRHWANDSRELEADSD